MGENVSATLEFETFVARLTYTYVLPTICFVGVLGNVANLVTLATPKLSAVSYKYLRALALSDLVVMFSTLAYCSVFTLGKDPRTNHIVQTHTVAALKAHILLPAINIPLNIGNLMVMALTLERFLSVCFPIWFRGINQPQRASVAIGGSVLLVILLHVPQTLRHEAACKANCLPGHNGTQVWALKQSHLYSTDLFITYKWIRECICKFIPIILIALMNLRIAMAFRKQRELRQKLGSASVASSQRQRDNRSLLYLLAGISVLFFTCKIPAAVNLIFITDERRRNLSYAKFRAAANLLEVTNHALNFFVFCLCSTDYRSIFIQKFPCVLRLCMRIRLTRSFLSSGLRRFSRPSTSRTHDDDSQTHVLATQRPPVKASAAVGPAPESGSSEESWSPAAQRPPLLDLIEEAEEQLSEIHALIGSTDRSPSPPRTLGGTLGGSRISLSHSMNLSRPPSLLSLPRPRLFPKSKSLNGSIPLMFDDEGEDEIFL